jgi:shikimate kinase
VRYEWNLDVIRGSGLIVLLTASLEELTKRVKSADRPRVNIGTKVEEDIRMIWESSKHKYYQAADLVYATDHKSIDEEVSEIKSIVLNQYEQSGK